MSKTQEKGSFEGNIGFGSLFLNSWKINFKNIVVPFLCFFLFHLVKEGISEYLINYIIGVVNDDYLDLLIVNAYNCVFTFFHVFNLVFLIAWFEECIHGRKKKIKDIFSRVLHSCFKDIKGFLIISFFHFLIGFSIPRFPQFFYIINIFVYSLMIYFKVEYFLVTPSYTITRKKQVEDHFRVSNRLLVNNWWKTFLLVVMNETLVSILVNLSIGPINGAVNTYTYLFLLPVKITVLSFIHGNLAGIVPAMMIVLYYIYSAEKGELESKEFPDGIDFLRYRKEIMSHLDALEDEQFLDEGTDLSDTFDPCPECGAPIPFFKSTCNCGLEVRRCPRCDALITRADEFCLNCGIQIPDKIRNSF